MKTRVTFRVPDELATALRAMPNQTRFVEEALRDALGRGCPVCNGTGRIPVRPLSVTNVRTLGLKRLTRDEAMRLQRVYRLAQEVAATRIELHKRGRRVTYRMMRDGSQLIHGALRAQPAG